MKHKVGKHKVNGVWIRRYTQSYRKVRYSFFRRIFSLSKGITLMMLHWAVLQTAQNWFQKIYNFLIRSLRWLSLARSHFLVIFLFLVVLPRWKERWKKLFQKLCFCCLLLPSVELKIFWQVFPESKRCQKWPIYLFTSQLMILVKIKNWIREELIVRFTTNLFTHSHCEEECALKAAYAQFWGIKLA